ncbi:hypothetical protein ACOMHN_065378 [Nucella lapillus]
MNGEMTVVASTSKNTQEALFNCVDWGRSVSALEEHEKRVTLSSDGMTVTKALTYSHHRDELVGFVNCGEHHQSDEIADQAILVMIRGLTLKWKQVLGYFVAKHNLTTPTLTAIISEIVRTVTGIGLYVDAIVMDQ